MKETAIQNLKDISGILNSYKATHWLEGGTMLGAYRDNDFCKGDEDDIDLGVWANYQYLIPEIIEQAKAQGFDLYQHYRDKDMPDFAQQLAFKRKRVKVDLIFYEKQKDNAVGCVYSNNNGWSCIPRVVPSHFYENLAEIVFHGSVYNIPKDIEQCLEYQYGNWQTPIHRSEYSCYNPSHLHSLKPDYKI